MSLLIKDKPTVISAIGAIPKPDSDEVRLIHDCSMPEGQGLNSYVKKILIIFSSSLLMMLLSY